MTIAFVNAPPIGNAVRLTLEPPAGSKYCRLLRRPDDNFTDENDSGATVICSDWDETDILDTNSVVNGTLYYYRAFYFDGSTWTPSASVSITPAATYTSDDVDVLLFVLDRLRAGLNVELARGTLIHEEPVYPVHNAPPLFEGTKWPVVTVHLQSDAPAERGVGEMLRDDFSAATGIEESEGWLARWQITIAGWTLNPDQRIALRQALKRILMANLPVFDGAGMVEVDFRFQDVDELERYPAQVYQVMCDFSCLAPASVTRALTPISDTDVVVAAISVPVYPGS